MNAWLHRLALIIAGIALRLLPPDQRPWGAAMLGELVTIPRGGEAVRFALGCLGHGLRAGLAARPLLIGVLCAIGATGLGLVHLALTGAPGSHLAINAAALVIGLLALANLRLLARLVPVTADNLALLICAMLAGSTMLGNAAQGAQRWLTVGGATIQPSLILVPLLVCALARSTGNRALLALAIAAQILAWQPDRAMAGALAASMAGLFWRERTGPRALAVGIAISAFAVTLVRPDLGERVPYVDQILWLAFAQHPLAGLAVWIGSALLLVPAIVARPTDRSSGLAFGLFWGAAILAAALGNYPTPLVGYGSSAVIGYCLALLGIAPRQSASVGCAPTLAPRKNERSDGVWRRLALP